MTVRSRSLSVTVGSLSCHRVAVLSQSFIRGPHGLALSVHDGTGRVLSLSGQVRLSPVATLAQAAATLLSPGHLRHVPTRATVVTAVAVVAERPGLKGRLVAAAVPGQDVVADPADGVRADALGTEVLSRAPAPVGRLAQHGGETDVGAVSHPPASLSRMASAAVGEVTCSSSVGVQ